jgi:hypothetical protein
MDIDPKKFFDEPPRMKEDVRIHLRDTINAILSHIYAVLYKLQLDTVGPKHVKVAIVCMTNDLVTMYVRDDLLVQSSRIKPLTALLCRSVDRAISRIADGCKNGRVDKKVIKFVEHFDRDHALKVTSAGMIAIASVVYEICDMLLQSASFELDRNKSVQTLSSEHVRVSEGIVRLKHGDRYVHAALLRFLAVTRAAAVDKKKERVLFH